MTVRIINADVLDGLRGLPDEYVHCIVTSPPYFGLRDYGTGAWEGGDQGCDHRKSAGVIASSTLSGGKKTTGHAQEGFKDLCQKCGAVRVDKQIGIEATPEDFIAKMVEVFREARRVLRKDGTCWVNMGDSYCSTDKWGGGGEGKSGKQTVADDGSVPSWAVRTRKQPMPGIKPKDLIGVPWMLAFALRADGWWLRSDIIWAKPNPMPESVTDRPTKAHEYLFLLTKAERYFYDAKAVSEPATYSGLANQDDSGFKNPRSFKGKHKEGYRSSDKQRGHGRRHAGFNDRWDAMERSEQCSGLRNKRSVWTIATTPFAEAHFATFPTEIPEICIKAGCPKGGTVLDPFAGAGTTLMVADRLQRNGIGIELNPEYAAMAERRINGDRGALLDLMEAAQ